MDAADAGFAGTMRAAIKGALRLDAVADDFAIAVLAFWGERVNCAFKAVKIVRLPHDGDLQRFVVIVPANFTFVHTSPPLFCVLAVTTAALASAFDHPIMFCVHDAFLHQLLCICLFVMRRDGRGGAAAGATDGFAQFGV